MSAKKSRILSFLSIAVLVSASITTVVAQESLAIKEAYAPKYPEGARQARAEGEAIVRVSVSPEGEVVGATFIEGNPLFASIGETYARRWKFAPFKEKELRDQLVTFMFKLLPEAASDEDEAIIFLSPATVKVIRRVQSVHQVTSN